MAVRPSTLLRRLERKARTFGPDVGAEKLELLASLERRWLPTANALLRLHELLCYLQAYPDDRAVLDRTQRMLDAFSVRRDLVRHRASLVDSGVSGTVIHYRFYWPMARRLVERWPDRLFLQWDDDEAAERLRTALPLLVRPVDAESVRSPKLTARAAIDRLRAPDETDASFVVRRIASLPGTNETREWTHDTLDLGYRLEPGPGTPARTSSKWPASPVVFSSEPPSRARPDLETEIRRPPVDIRDVSPRRGRRLVDLALDAMVTRSRDLEAFGYGDPADVRIVDDGEGLQFVCIGVRPGRRGLLHAIYGYLTLRNGVPIGYVQVDCLLGAAAVSYNTFESFRGGEAAGVFGRMLAATHALFGSTSFSIEPYQLGAGNAEGIASGAWWFYYKLGFRPRDREVRRLVTQELARIDRDARYRSAPGTLRRLASAHLFFSVRGARRALDPPPWRLGGAVASCAAESAGESTRGAARMLGVRSWSRWPPAERAAWEAWSPLAQRLPGVAGWSRQDRQALVQVVRAKGRRRESEFVRLFDEHPRLGRAVTQVCGHDRGLEPLE